MTFHSSPVTHHVFSWSEIDDVLLDMDGTILDRHFDNFFFEEELPRRYAAQNGLTADEARNRLLAMYRAVEGELNWTDLDYWTRVLNIDVVALTRELNHMMQYLPGALEFLIYLRRSGKRVTVLTNAHPTGMRIKQEKTGFDRHVDRIVTAFDVGYLKMRKDYWPECRRLLAFDPSRSLYVDDDEACLAAADLYGMTHVIHSAKSSTQLPPHPSRRFPSIETLASLI